MTLFVVAPQLRIAQEWIIREGLALSQPKVVIPAKDMVGRMPTQAAVATLVVLDIPGMAYDNGAEAEISYTAQRGVPVLRLNPNTMHDQVAVAPMEPDFTPPEFATAEEAQEWLDAMSKVIARRPQPPPSSTTQLWR